MKSIFNIISVVFNIPFFIFFGCVCSYTLYKDFKNEGASLQLTLENIKDYVKPIFFRCHHYSTHVNWLTWILITYLILF